MMARYWRFREEQRKMEHQRRGINMGGTIVPRFEFHRAGSTEDPVRAIMLHLALSFYSL